MKKTQYITYAALIAALYVLLTYVSNIFGLASGAIQFRISEALTILPIITSAAIPGLTIGCLVANILTGCTLIDIIFGSFATLLGAIGTYLIGKLHMRRKEYLAPIPPIFFNTLIIPFVLAVSLPQESVWFIMLTVFIGEFLSCSIPGILLYKALMRRAFSKSNDK